MYTDEQGAQAIIDLQKFAGITETMDQAKAGWAGMSLNEREGTEDAHVMVCGGFSSNDCKEA